MITGYEQVRSIAADIAGDREAAERVELDLPETGVCTRAGVEGGARRPGAAAARCLWAWRPVAPTTRRQRLPARPAAAVLDGSRAIGRHRRARHRADAGVGIELLSAGDPGRSDRARPRNLQQLVLRGVLGLAGDLRIARSPGRPPDRSRWRPAGALCVERIARCGPGAARRIDDRVDDVGRLASARHRHGSWPLRRRVRRPGPHLRQRRAWRDHRHHVDRRFRQHRRLAAEFAGTRDHRLAGDLLRLGGSAHRDRPAA